ncbi:hypothetical protein [Rubinisphaera italica]|uniref:Uncharacterized protein n=1 Tax=Rubinisphaera italica TaxID=2527969 RepID=A0A5C5XNU3_9PLAN|nr:hypothetical protein [Rubinisphaera italica]TWT64219.1 hypothetical protein Pan54_49800 [Rubinisphaera italica]
MKAISTAGLKNHQAELDGAMIRLEVERFTTLLSKAGIESVRVWCSYNPDLPDDSPFQSPEATVPPESVMRFLNDAIRNNVWHFGDSWNRSGIEGVDGSFKFFLGNDKDITLETVVMFLFDRTRTAWEKAGYEIAYHD